MKSKLDAVNNFPSSYEVANMYQPMFKEYIIHCLLHGYEQNLYYV